MGPHQTETADVRRALKAELEARGHQVASDSHGLRTALYIVGDADLARALFEFKDSAAEACDTMYQGSWGAGMPPRFAVMPEEESASPEFEMLEQARIVPLLYVVAGGGIVFRGLDATLAEHLGGQQSNTDQQMGFRSR